MHKGNRRGKARADRGVPTLQVDPKVGGGTGGGGMSRRDNNDDLVELSREGGEVEREGIITVHNGD
eukprot:CAMPEP_0201534588 /NCGR_PEP_ID=MMETSP0161_2-20130828/56733_1 /ASSEMBLY_ACC=CAM_ASM_000251 /TAXON_ID=180227 /ORGANISM="Neoparamoeba aestuarina, Strain SoJaBio B1-5/56/2" /LENGTH=65 /DNA_ID=CAMNT_0047939315 /DNA_START=216 /DNA_END=413 /DNA_ORIENTATION=-